jgi:hypothetical protein
MESAGPLISALEAFHRVWRRKESRDVLLAMPAPANYEFGRYQQGGHKRVKFSKTSFTLYFSQRAVADN